jgi:uncharacterized protein (TIGR02145 family)
MLKTVIFCLWMLSSMLLFGQNLNMTFTAAGAADKVDSVKATNLRTHESITLPGNDTLLLSVNTGIILLSELNSQGIVFPNPFPGKTTLVANIRKAQTISLEVYTLVGQSVARTQAMVQPGAQTFALSLSRVGVYMVSLTTTLGTEGFKIICTETTGTRNQVSYTGPAQENLNQSIKASAIYTLGYSIGDIVLYRCRGGIHKTIITDSPDVSKNYTVEFVPCIDPDSKSYAIVKISTQTWMAENLAWLPAVSKSGEGADSLPYYYVYDYEDSLVTAAKNTVNYKIYGVLYNWTAAMNQGGKKSTMSGQVRAVCPAGWHMPDDDEWKILEMALGMTQADADTLYWRISGEVGKKLKSSVGWADEGNGINANGFTALPGGYRNIHGGFWNEGKYSLFWTASIIDTTSWYRSLSDIDSGVYRISTYRSNGLSVRCIKDTR